MYFGCHRPNIYNNAIRFGLNIYISATDHNLGFLGLLVLGPKWASVVTIEWVKALSIKCLFYPIYILNPTDWNENCMGMWSFSVWESGGVPGFDGIEGAGEGCASVAEGEGGNRGRLSLTRLSEGFCEDSTDLID
ncbi:hypothetical protein ACFX2C_006084 [Malus domestica]